MKRIAFMVLCAILLSVIPVNTSALPIHTYRDSVTYFLVTKTDGSTYIAEQKWEEDNKGRIHTVIEGMGIIKSKKEIVSVQKMTGKELKAHLRAKEKHEQSVAMERKQCSLAFDKCIDATPTLDQDCRYDNWDKPCEVAPPGCGWILEVYYDGYGKYGWGVHEIKHVNWPGEKRTLELAKELYKDRYIREDVQIGMDYVNRWEEARDNHKKECKVVYDDCRRSLGLEPHNWDGPDSKLYKSIYEKKDEDNK